MLTISIGIVSIANTDASCIMMLFSAHRDTGQTTAYKDLTSLHANFEWFEIAQNRTGWNQLIAPVRS